MSQRTVEDMPDEFRTANFKYNKEHDEHGNLRFRKGGQFTSINSFTSAFFQAHTDVTVFDESGDTEQVTVRRDWASRMGEIANDPQEDESITVKTADGRFIEMTHQDIADAFRQAEQEGQRPIRYIK